MAVTKSLFGKSPEGKEISLYTLSNSKGMKAAVTDLGATLVRVLVPDAAGKADDLVLGFDNGESYYGNDSFFGTVIGPCANRTGGAEYTLDGVTYQLDKNDGVNNLHTHKQLGFHKRLWDAEIGENSVTFSLEDEDGQLGFPGNKKVSVTYSLSEENELTLHYHASSDKKTIINLTNHSYFNLAGQGNIEQQILTLNAPFITETDDALIPTGHDLPVDGLPVDFRAGLRLGEGFARGSEYPMMVAKNGYDFNFTVAGSGMRCFGSLYDPQSGRVMHLCSTEPCVQVYSGQHMDFSGHHGAHYGCHAGLALETQHHPDAIHHAAFPSVVLRANTPYETQTVYSFSVK